MTFEEWFEKNEGPLYLFPEHKEDYALVWNACAEEAAEIAESKDWPLSCPLGLLVDEIRSLKETE